MILFSRLSTFIWVFNIFFLLSFSFCCCCLWLPFDEFCRCFFFLLLVVAHVWCFGISVHFWWLGLCIWVHIWCLGLWFLVAFREFGLASIVSLASMKAFSKDALQRGRSIAHQRFSTDVTDVMCQWWIECRFAPSILSPRQYCMIWPSASMKPIVG